MGDIKKTTAWDTCAYGIEEAGMRWCYLKKEPCEVMMPCKAWEWEGSYKRDEQVIPEVAHDAIDHPSHYCKGRMEFWDAMAELLTYDEYVGAMKYNAMKYICRLPDKDDPQQDADKAIAYVNKLKEYFE